MDRKDLTLPSTKLSRREAGIILIGTAAALAASPEVALASHTEKLTPPVYIPTLNPRDRLKNTIDQFGGRRLTVDETHDVFSQQAEWNASMTKPIIDPAIFQRFYVLTHGPDTTVKPALNPLADPMKNLVVVKFYERYPDYPYTPENGKRILSVYNSGHIAGTPDSIFQESFLVLDAVNNPKTFVPRGEEYSYEGPFENPKQSEIQPIHRLVSSGQHEGVHQTYWGLRTSLDPEIVHYLQNFQGKNNNTIIGEHDNFSVNYTSKSPDGKIVVPSYRFELNEFSTDYTSATTLLEADLTYTPGYGFKPRSFDNFRKILNQSGVDFANFVHLYDKGFLKELYQAIAMGAEKGSKKLFQAGDKPENLTAFGIQILPWWNFPEWNPRPGMPDIKEYFRGLAA